LHKDPAADLGVEVGDTIDVTFPDGATDTLTVAAIYADSTIFDNWVIDLALWDQHFHRTELSFVSATIAGFSDALPEDQQQELLGRSGAAVQSVIDNYPGVKAENRVEFRQSQEQQLDSFLATIQVFLALALIIALVGIANTLALSVFERTREIGLLRSVGMTRRQLRRAVRWEAAIVAVFGALLGVGLGVIFGVAATIAIPDTFVKEISIPTGSLVVYVVIAALAGLIAAILPARRAGRMDVLEAIAH
jgi:putative ABC transport system permease protein